MHAARDKRVVRGLGEGEKGSISFLKKRNKKLLSVAVEERGYVAPMAM
jgi:hypothetical protein